jgi:RAT1-interacting protein
VSRPGFGCLWRAVPFRKEIFVGFRSRDGILQSTQTFNTLEIPRLVRGKGQHSWDPGFALDFAERFLVFLRRELSNTGTDSKDVWRVTFTPKIGLRVIKLNTEEDLSYVRGGEDRIGFLPRTFYESREM